MSYSRAHLDDLQRRVQGMLVRGTVRSVDDAMMKQLLDIELEHGHRPTKVEHWQPYGMHFHPKQDAEVIAAALGGNRDHMVVLGTSDRRYRPKNLQPGEVQIYDHQGMTMTFKTGNEIELKNGGSQIIMRPGEIILRAGAIKHESA